MRSQRVRHKWATFTFIFIFPRKESHIQSITRIWVEILLRAERALGQPLGTKSGPWRTVSMEEGSQSYNCKELNSATNLRSSSSVSYLFAFSYCLCLCSHEIKRHLLLGKKAMTNLHSVFKSKDITLPTEVWIVKSMIFPIVKYECESWTIKKAESWRIDAFEL